MGPWSVGYYTERFTSHDVISARQIFDLLNVFLAQKYLILNFPYILIASNRCFLSHRELISGQWFLKRF